MELLVVLVILGLLGGLVGPSLFGALGKSKSEVAKTQIGNFEQTLEMYRLDVGRFPTTEEGLQALVVRPGNAAGWNGPYLKKSELPLDPWGQPYLYRSPGERGEIDIFTFGKDMEQGGEGEDRDVGNWQ